MLATSLSQVCGFIATIRSTPPRRPRQPASTTRTSYHVGSPWMFDGKLLRAATGTPIQKIDRANSPFADADPEPLTFANLTTKSLTRVRLFTRASITGPRSVGRHRCRFAWRGRAMHPIIGVRHVEQEFLHVPGTGRTTLGAQP